MSESLPSGAGALHLWLAFDERLRGAPLLGRFEACMSAEERERWLRFRHEPSKLRHLVARGLMRGTLSRYVPRVNAADWRFETTGNGKPRIAAVHDTVGLHFNLTHTDGLTALAVVRDAEVGLDAENIERHAALEVADQYFSDEEVAGLNALEGADRHLRFYELWTLKEAYLKATGSGLSTPLDQISFDFASGIARLVDEPAEGWRFALFHVGRQHVMAVGLRAEEWPVLAVRELGPEGEVTDRTLTARRTFVSRKR